MSMLVAAFVGLCLYGMIRILNLASPSFPPNIYARTRSSEFVQAILSSCPILREPYVPPLLWGKNGHIQTVVYAKVGRMRDPVPSGVRHSKTLADGSTLTFDVYEPTAGHKSNGQYCMLVCPGFGSSSESSYIRGLTHSAQSAGYHVAVLNHLGSLFSVRLTAPRIFSYGGWEEFHIMRQEVEHLHPQCKLIVVGLSMGANIVLKYLGEIPVHQQGVVCAISVCQGYNINEAKLMLKKWESCRRAYLHIMTANQRRLIRHHGNILFDEHNRRRFGFDTKKIFAATTLEELDSQFTCKLQGYQDVVTYYEKNSCSNYLGNIDIPMILLNSEDDPIVPPPLLRYAREYVDNHEEAVFITTKHGGHLGYFESGYVRPDAVSWLDRCICQVADAVVGFFEEHRFQKASPILPIVREDKMLLGVGERHPQSDVIIVRSAAGTVNSVGVSDYMQMGVDTVGDKVADALLAICGDKSEPDLTGASAPACGSQEPDVISVAFSSSVGSDVDHLETAEFNMAEGEGKVKDTEHWKSDRACSSKKNRLSSDSSSEAVYMATHRLSPIPSMAEHSSGPEIMASQKLTSLRGSQDPSSDSVDQTVKRVSFLDSVSPSSDGVDTSMQCVSLQEKDSVSPSSDDVDTSVKCMSLQEKDSVSPSSDGVDTSVQCMSLQEKDSVSPSSDGVDTSVQRMSLQEKDSVSTSSDGVDPSVQCASVQEPDDPFSSAVDDSVKHVFVQESDSPSSSAVDRSLRCASEQESDRMSNSDSDIHVADKTDEESDIVLDTQDPGTWSINAEFPQDSKMSSNESSFWTRICQDLGDSSSEVITSRMSEEEMDAAAVAINAAKLAATDMTQAVTVKFVNTIEQVIKMTGEHTPSSSLEVEVSFVSSGEEPDCNPLAYEDTFAVGRTGGSTHKEMKDAAVNTTDQVAKLDHSHEETAVVSSSSDFTQEDTMSLLSDLTGISTGQVVKSKKKAEKMHCPEGHSPHSEMATVSSGSDLTQRETISLFTHLTGGISRSQTSKNETDEEETDSSEADGVAGASGGRVSSRGKKF